MASERENKNTSNGKKTHKARKLLWISLSIAALIVLLFLLVPTYLSSDSGTNMLIGKINGSIDGKVAMSNLSIGWFSGVELDDLSFADNAGTTSVKVKKVSANPSYTGFLFGKVDLGKATVDQPEIVLTIEQYDQTESTPPLDEPITVTHERQEMIGIPLDRLALEVKHGNVTINMKDVRNQTHSLKLSNIESKVDFNPPGTESSFDVTLDVEGRDSRSKIVANGKVTPDKKSWRLKPGSGGELNIKIDDLEIASLRPLLALAGQDIDMLGKLNADVKATISNGDIEKLTANAILENFKQVIDNKETVLTEPVIIDAEISKAGEVVKIEKLNIVSSFCQLDCKGDAERVDYSATANLNGLQEFTKQFIDFGIYDLAGNITADGNILMRDPGIKAKGNSTIKGLVVKRTDNGKTIPATNADITFDVSTNEQNTLFNIASMNITAGPGIGSVNISNSVLPLGDASKDEISLTVKADANLKSLMPYADVFDVLPEGMRIAGLLKANANISGTNRAMHVITKNSTIENVMIQKPDWQETIQDKLITVDADVILNMDEKTVDKAVWNIDGSQIKTNGNINQTITGSKTKLQGKVNVEYDLAQISQLAQAFLPAKLTMEGNQPLTVNFASEYRNDDTSENKVLKNMNADASLGFEKAGFMGMQFGKADMALNIKDGLLTIPPMAIGVNGGKLNLAGSIDFNEERPTLKIPQPTKFIENVQINDEMSDEMLKYLNPIFANQINVTGIANLQADKLEIPLGDGAKGDIDIVATVSMNDVKLSTRGLMGQIKQLSKTLDNQDISIEPTRFVLNDGILKYDNDMIVNLGKTPLSFGGQIALDKTMGMTVKVPVSVSGNKINAIVPIMGMVDKPQIDVGKALQQTLGQGLLEGLLKGKISEPEKEVDENTDGENKEDGKPEDIEDILKKEGRKILEDLFK